MKKYLVFLTSFVLFYSLYQIITGLALTALYNPELALINPQMTGEVAFGGAFPIIAILFIATLAYFFTEKLTTVKRSKLFIKK